MSGSLAARLAGIPVVRNSDERDALFPNPDTRQRVHNLFTATIQMWTGATWTDVFFAGALSTGTPQTWVNDAVIVAQPQVNNFKGRVVGAPDGATAEVTIPDLPVSDEGSVVVASPSGLDFRGAGVTVTDEGGVARVTIPGGGGGGGVNPGTPTAIAKYDGTGTNLQDSAATDTGAEYLLQYDESYFGLSDDLVQFKTRFYDFLAVYDDSSGAPFYTFTADGESAFIEFLARNKSGEPPSNDQFIGHVTAAHYWKNELASDASGFDRYASQMFLVPDVYDADLLRFSRLILTVCNQNTGASIGDTIGRFGFSVDTSFRYPGSSREYAYLAAKILDDPNGADRGTSLILATTPSGSTTPYEWEWPTSDGDPGDVLTTDGSGVLSFQPAAGGGGIVETIVAGSGITVDDTDPANPIVSASGGGGGGAEFPISAPSSPSSFNDEFTSATLDAKWTAISSAATSSVEYNRLGSWLSTFGYGDGVASNELLRVRQAITGYNSGTAFQVYARFNLSSYAGSSGGVRLLIGTSSTYRSGDYLELMAYVNSANITVEAYTGFTEATQTVPLGATQIYFAMRRKSSNVVYLYWSLDGIGWRLLWGDSTRAWDINYLWVSLESGANSVFETCAMCDFVRVGDSRLILPSRT